MNRVAKRAFAMALFCVAVLVGLYFLYEPPAPSMSPETTQLRDSLATTKPAFDSGLTAFDSLSSQLVERDRALAAANRRQRRSVDSARTVADSLRAAVTLAVTARDSIDALLLANDARTAEADSLRSMVDTLERRVEVLTLARDTALMTVAELRSRNEAIERLNAGLQRDLVKAAECTLLSWPVRVRCPSRTQTAIVSAGLGWIAAR